LDPPALEPIPPALYVEGLSKRYDGSLALDGLSFRLEAGRILGLVGPNGAGKTTALRSIAGVLPIQDGRVLVCGHDVQTDAVAAKRCLGWVPDDPEPFDALTVQEHLEFVASLFRVRDWKAAAERLLERFELTAKRDALGGELSRGMRQKLAFACAWLPRPRLVLRPGRQPPRLTTSRRRQEAHPPRSRTPAAIREVTAKTYARKSAAPPLHCPMSAAKQTRFAHASAEPRPICLKRAIPAAIPAATPTVCVRAPVEPHPTCPAPATRNAMTIPGPVPAVRRRACRTYLIRRRRSDRAKTQKRLMPPPPGRTGRRPSH